MWSKMAMARVPLRTFAQRRFMSSGDKMEMSAGTKMWKSLTLFVAIPIVVLASINEFMPKEGKHHERPEFVPYPYLRIRTKASGVSYVAVQGVPWFEIVV